MKVLPDYLKVTNDYILLLLVGQETGLVDINKISLNAFDRLLDVLQVVLKGLFVLLAHTDRASFRISFFQLSGSAPGVRTSTSIPRSSLISARMAVLRKYSQTVFLANQENRRINACVFKSYAVFHVSGTRLWKDSVR
jgi:hypothetical protein